MSRRVFAVILWFAMTVSLSIGVEARPSARERPDRSANQPAKGAAAPAPDQDIVESYPTDEFEADVLSMTDNGGPKPDFVLREQPREADSGASLIAFLILLLAVLGLAVSLGLVMFRRIPALGRLIAVLDQRIEALERDRLQRHPAGATDRDQRDPSPQAFATSMPLLSSTARPQPSADPSPIRSPSPAREAIEPAIALSPPRSPPAQRPVIDPIARSADFVPTPVALPQDRPRSAGSATIRELLDEVSRLIASPSFKISDYDVSLGRFGEIYGVRFDQERLRLIEPDSNVYRRLSAILTANDHRAVIIPSAQWIKGFDMTYKESLEAGEDVAQLFDLCPDGSGVLKMGRPAFALIDREGCLSGIERGVLLGFVR